MSDLFRVVHAATGVMVTAQDLSEIALSETWAKGLVYCDIDGFALMADGMLALLDECGSYAFPPTDRFKVEWL